MSKLSSTPALVRRRRLLGALAVAGSTPAIVRAGLSGTPASTPSAAPVTAEIVAADSTDAFDGVVPRERWMLRRDDR